ncbi:MAG: DNA polymerase III subunit chi [Sneathiella sp.]
MTEVSFYHLQAEPLDRALPKLLDKVHEREMRALVRLKSEALAERLDAALWTFSPTSFLPHGTESQEHADQQPVLLSLHAEGNANQATVLVLLEDSEASDLDQFDRCLYMFDGNDSDALNAARTRWKSLKQDGADVTYWQQGSTGWQKKA